MSIYLQTTPSLYRKKMTKKSRQLLEQENKDRAKRGMAPLDSLRFEKLDKDAVRSASNMPNYNWNPRGVSTDHIKSLNPENVDTNATARNTVMDKVARGEITGKDAEEILRKSKSMAPAYSKGAYQYIGSNEAARDAGKKV